MTRSNWPVRFGRTTDGLDIAMLVKPDGGCDPPFLVVNPLGTPARHSSELIPAIAEFCDAFLGDNACYEFEWRGTGLSAGHDRVLEIRHLALDIEAVAHVIGRPFHLLAFGCATLPALEFASQRPPHLLSLLLETPNLRFWLSDLPGLSDEEVERRLATSLRMQYDFPPHVVAQELTPALRRDLPMPLVKAWAEMFQRFSMEKASWREIEAPVLIYTRPQFADEATVFGRALPASRTIIARALAGNALWATALRDAFNAFWAEVSGEPAASPANGANGLLSNRELEVLRLLAAGKSNRQVAEALVLSKATVATHVRHILEKTGSANRAEATAYAVRNGLA